MAKRYCAATDQLKKGIAGVIEKKVSIETHQSFVRAVHRPQRPGKSPSGQTVDYLVMNYDTAFEDALALERVPFADGLEGGVTGWWSPRHSIELVLPRVYSSCTDRSTGVRFQMILCHGESAIVFRSREPPSVGY